MTGSLIQSLAGELADSLEAVSNPEQVAEAHAARIRAKRLRYLLEPLSRRVAGAKTLVGRLKQLQDLLGQVHDLQVLAGEIDSSLAALSKAPPTGRFGPARAGGAPQTGRAGRRRRVRPISWPMEPLTVALRFRSRTDELSRRLTGDTPTDSEPGPESAGRGGQRKTRVERTESGPRVTGVCAECRRPLARSAASFASFLTRRADSFTCCDRLPSLLDRFLHFGRVLLDLCLDRFLHRRLHRDSFTRSAVLLCPIHQLVAGRTHEHRLPAGYRVTRAQNQPHHGGADGDGNGICSAWCCRLVLIRRVWTRA